MKDLLAKELFIDAILDGDFTLRLKQGWPLSLRAVPTLAMELESYPTSLSPKWISRSRHGLWYSRSELNWWAWLREIPAGWCSCDSKRTACWSDTQRFGLKCWACFHTFFTPLEWFQLIQIFEALPTQWRKSLTSCGPKSGKTFFLYDQIKLYLKNQAVQIENVLSKNVYSEIRARYEARPTAQARFEEQFPNICLDWRDIYKLPFSVLIDTKSREFQYRILNRYLTTNSFLYKIGLANSPLCKFCKQESKSLEHLLIICSCTKSFWLDFITWSNQLNIFLRDLTDSDKPFGFWQRKEDYLFINHMLVLAKQHIYECHNKCTYPSFTIF